MSEATIRWEQDADNIVTLILDDPQQSANTMNERYMRSMEEMVARLEKEKDQIAGVIVTSAKSTFFAGGDVKLGFPLGIHGKPRQMWGSGYPITV